MFSIVIPVYNRSVDLAACLDSIAKQTYRCFEVLVCDDGSTENISSVCENFKLIIDIRYVKCEHSGNPASPRYAGVLLSRYDWICFIDSDDLMFPNKLAETKLAIESEEPDIVYHKLLSSGVSRSLRLWRMQAVGFPVFGAPFESLLTLGNSIPMSSSCIRREVATALGSQRTDLWTSQDYEYWIRAAQIGSKIVFLNRTLGLYKISHNARSDAYARKNSDLESIFLQYKNQLPEARRIQASSLLRLLLAWNLVQAGDYKRAKMNLAGALRIRSLRLKMRVAILYIYCLYVTCLRR